MPACPWCKAATADLLAPCPRCGRLADEQSGLAPGLAGLGDVPDLDIPARPSRASIKVAPKVAPKAGPAAPKPTPAPLAAPPPAASRGAERTSRADQADRDQRANNAFNDPGARTFDAMDDDDDDGAPLDLDLSKGPPLIAEGRPEAKPPSAPGAQAPAPPPPSPTAALAKGARPVRVEVDPHEARVLADYGEAPSEWWRMPKYAYRVLRRRPELKKLADLKRREAERAEGAAEDALLSFAEIVRSDAEKLGAYASTLQGVRATEQVLGQKDAILAAETDAHKHRQAEHDAKIAELEAQISRIQIEERQVAGELAEADTLLKRAEARAKRLEIEMRNAIEQAQTDAGVPTEGAKGPGQ